VLRIKRSSLLVLLIFSFITSQSQDIDTLMSRLKSEKNDSIRGTLYTQLAEEHISRDINLAKTYIDSAESIDVYSSLPSKKLKINYVRGAIAERQQLFDTARYYFLQILDDQVVMTDSSLVAKTYYKLGNMSRRNNENDKAISYLNKSKDLNISLEKPLNAADADVVLGIIYKNNAQYDQAIEYYSAAYEVYEKESDYDPMATCILNIANVYGRQDNWEGALENYNRTLEIAKKLKHNEGLLSFVYSNRANAQRKLGFPEKSLEDSKRAYDLRKDKASPEEKAHSLIGIGHSLSSLNRIDEAIDYYNQAKVLSEKSEGMLETKERVYEALFYIYAKSDRDKQAVDAARLYISYKDSVRNTELDKKVLQLNEQLETEKKENEIIRLNNDNELAHTKLTAARIQTYGLIAGLLIISSILLGLFRLYRRTQVQKAIIAKALGEKNTLLKEIHHRVKNNLQFISSLLRLQTKHVSDDAALGALQEGQDRVQSMALIHQNLYQEDNLTGVDMKVYFQKLIKGLFSSYNIHDDRIQLELDIADVNLDVDTVIPLGLIVNELISNSLKHAFPDDRAGQILVRLDRQNDVLLLSVKDDGVGITDENRDKMTGSFGYKLINAFTQQLEADMIVDSSEGTSVAFEIKNFEVAA